MSRHRKSQPSTSLASIMAPASNAGKRVKGIQVARPFVYGTTARPFDPVKNPKPPGVPEDHTHSWTAFVKGVDDTDITYWLKRVQFKLHESYKDGPRMIDGEAGKPFVIHETGWGEFEIAIKMHYVAESGEKPHTVYHMLKLHAFGTDQERAAQVSNAEVRSWVYEEQLFNEPYEHFFDILTSGALPPSDPNFTAPTPGGKKGTGKGKVAAGKPGDVRPKRSEGGVLERSAMIPMKSTPDQPFSHEAEKLELTQISNATAKVMEMLKAEQEAITKKTEYLTKLKAEAMKEQNKEEAAAA
ncbi:NuA4 histone H4 acetyltransferase complex and the SWR1 complex subunit [Gnomoniopsis sp. IMI 355080]|nr:NuA4 histone H4 acetyltransferase complex and the SWR1 complex subunit [Gnomoniopsis sp. IMI 355080]